jgi:hypothetical protein
MTTHQHLSPSSRRSKPKHHHSQDPINDHLLHNPIDFLFEQQTSFICYTLHPGITPRIVRVDLQDLGKLSARVHSHNARMRKTRIHAWPAHAPNMWFLEHEEEGETSGNSKRARTPCRVWSAVGCAFPCSSRHNWLEGIRSPSTALHPSTKVSFLHCSGKRNATCLARIDTATDPASGEDVGTRNDVIIKSLSYRGWDAAYGEYVRRVRGANAPVQYTAKPRVNLRDCAAAIMRLGG